MITREILHINNNAERFSYLLAAMRFIRLDVLINGYWFNFGID